MKKIYYLYGTGLPILLSLLTLAFAYTKPMFQEHLGFYFICLFAFLLFAILTVLVGIKTHNHRNPGLFGTSVLSAMTFKMLASIMLVVVYVKVYPPQGKWFVLPFFLMYLYFTIFEAWALIRIGRST